METPLSIVELTISATGLNSCFLHYENFKFSYILVFLPFYDLGSEYNMPLFKYPQ